MKQKSNRLTVFLLTFSILTALILPISAVFPSMEDAKLYDGVIRLHVIANSDSDEDQALKLKVRDEVLETLAGMLCNAESKEAAYKIISENLPAIEAAAKDVLSKNSSDYKVGATITNEVYPTREYGDISLPAGEYTSLRIQIGEAVGKNWWCMIFPSFCAGAVGEDFYITVTDEELVAAGLTPSQVRIITGNTPDVKIKFRILEFVSEILR